MLTSLFAFLEREENKNKGKWGTPYTCTGERSKKKMDPLRHDCVPPSRRRQDKANLTPTTQGRIVPRGSENL